LVRRVNILADKALLSAFADNVYQVTPRHIDAAVNDSEFGLKPKWYQLDSAKTDPRSKYTWWAILLLAMAGLGMLAAVLVYPQPKPLSSAESKPAKESIALAAATPSAADVAPTVTDMQQLLVNQRLLATDSLLLSASPETISLQIQSVPTVLSAGEHQDDLLKTALAGLRRQLEMDNIYLYRMQQNNSDYTVILYGAFAQRVDALNALNSLPEQIKSNQPYLRTVAGVKKDIELSQKSKPNS